ncbi:unnamed protein product [Dracunculus medinensis]|uniref:Uncharacterized protein n=1 Tax=Dracunculus medinensis TaxID=318479 RepID=A0A0N4UAM1_DRAME|nr:unnamed protein product [Dracunculus medinensis]
MFRFCYGQPHRKNGTIEVVPKTVAKAIFGFHTIATLIVFTIFMKFRSRFSFAQFLLGSGLFCYIPPTSKELKEKIQIVSATKNRKRRFIRYSDILCLPHFITLSWIVDFTVFTLLIYSLSEIFCFIFPDSVDINVSIVWLLLAIGFLLQALANMVVTFFSGEKLEAERNLMISFAAVFFLFSMIFMVFGERFFDVTINKAYESFINSTSEFFTAVDFSDNLQKRSPILLFVSFSVMFAAMSSMLVFPNFRYARMYTNVLNDATPGYKLIYHSVFLLQIFPLILFTNPVRNYLLNGPRIRLTEEELASLRIISTVISTLVRVAFYRSHLQSHLNLAKKSLEKLHTQAGNINNNELQQLVYRYLSYLNVAALQYFIPALLPLFVVLLLKTLGDYSWLGTQHSYAMITRDKKSLASLRLLFNKTVQRGLWSLCLIITLLVNISLSTIGVIYNSYFDAS